MRVVEIAEAQRVPRGDHVALVNAKPERPPEAQAHGARDQKQQHHHLDMLGAGQFAVYDPAGQW